MDVTTLRAQMEEAITQVRALLEQEAELERHLAGVRRRREAMDVVIQMNVKTAELSGLESAEWRQLLDGMRPEVAAACGRASLQPR